jgi:hypothetical protein
MPTAQSARSAITKPVSPHRPLAPVRKTRSTRGAPKLTRAAAQPRPLASDAVIRAATGRTWAQWFRLLDRFDVAGAGHSATVRHLADEHACPRWWRQRIAEAHAESRGLQAPASRTHSANTSRTLSVSVEDLYRAWLGRAPAKWLHSKFKVQRANEYNSLRLDWPDHTTVEIYFWAKGERRSQVNVMHRQLASASEVAQKKSFWATALDKLQLALE